MNAKTIPGCPHVSLNAGLVHNIVNLVRRDARPNGSRCDVQHLSRQPAHLAHAVLGLGIQLGDLVGPDECPAEFGNAIFGVVGMRDRLGNLALRGEGVDWAQGTGEVEGREGVEVAGFWIWFRDDLGWKDVAQNTVLLLVGVLVRSLGTCPSVAVFGWREASREGQRMAYPILLEAVLRAEVAVLDA
jgi:hypothetical protein